MALSLDSSLPIMPSTQKKQVAEVDHICSAPPPARVSVVGKKSPCIITVCNNNDKVLVPRRCKRNLDFGFRGPSDAALPPARCLNGVPFSLWGHRASNGLLTPPPSYAWHASTSCSYGGVPCWAGLHLAAGGCMELSPHLWVLDFARDALITIRPPPREIERTGTSLFFR